MDGFAKVAHLIYMGVSELKHRRFASSPGCLPKPLPLSSGDFSIATRAVSKLGSTRQMPGKPILKRLLSLWAKVDQHDALS
jgi:hypothetical protein